MISIPKILFYSLLLFIAIIAWSFFVVLFLPIAVSAQTQIYRSLQFNKTSALATGSGNNLTISSGTATFASALPDTIGVGDVIQYDANGDGTVDNLAFIHARTSSTSYTVRDSLGVTTNLNDVTNDQDWGIYRAYITMQNAEDGTENTGINASLRNFDSGNRDISNTGADENWNFACYRGEETINGQVSFDAWNTSAGRYLKFYSPYLPSEVGTSQRHNGTLNVISCYAIRRITSGGTLIAINTSGTGNPDHVWFDGIQILNNLNATTTANGILIQDLNSDADNRVSNCIFVGSDSASTGVHSAIDLFSSSGTIGLMKVWNTVFYDWRTSNTVSNAAVSMRSANGTTYVYNCTAYNCRTGYRRSAGTLTVKNSIANRTSDGFIGTCTNCDYNLSSIAADAGGASSRNGLYAEYINVSGDNYMLAATDTNAINRGTDLSGDVIGHTDDIQRETRPYGAAWDMGADEFTPSGRKIIFGLLEPKQHFFELHH